MDEFITPWMSGVRLALFFGMSGACFTFGVAIVCRLMEWSPVNITVNVNNYDHTRESKIERATEVSSQKGDT